MEKESLVEKIDSSLSSKGKNQLFMLFFLVFLLIFYVVYSSLDVPSSDFFNSNKAFYAEKKSKADNEEKYINSMKSGNTIANMRKTLAEKVAKKDQLIYLNNYVDQKISDISYLLFNDKGWAKFVDDIVFLAKKYNINIQNVSSEFNSPSLQKIEHIIKLEIEFTGSFKNILNFINSIEASELVVDVHHLELLNNNEINGIIKIAVWGMKY